MLSKKVKTRIRQNKNYRKNIHQIKQVLQQDGNIAYIRKIKSIFKPILRERLTASTICGIACLPKRINFMSDHFPNQDPSQPVTLVKHTLTKPLTGFKYGEMELYSPNIKPN